MLRLKVVPLGAETLLGNGDMLVGQGDSFNRVHGAYLEQDELLEIISKIKNKYQAPKYLELPEEIKNQNSENDNLFDKAIELIKEKRSASNRLLIRELKVGHTTASRLIDQLEKEGYISPLNEDNLRAVLI